MICVVLVSLMSRNASNDCSSIEKTSACINVSSSDVDKGMLSIKQYDHEVTWLIILINVKQYPLIE